MRPSSVVNCVGHRLMLQQILLPLWLSLSLSPCDFVGHGLVISKIWQRTFDQIDMYVCRNNSLPGFWNVTLSCSCVWRVLLIWSSCSMRIATWLTVCICTHICTYMQHNHWQHVQWQWQWHRDTAWQQLSCCYTRNRSTSFEPNSCLFLLNVNSFPYSYGQMWMEEYHIRSNTYDGICSISMLSMHSKSIYFQFKFFKSLSLVKLRFYYGYLQCIWMECTRMILRMKM